MEDAQGIATVNVRSWQVAYRGLVPQDFLDGLDSAQSCLRWERTLSSQSGRDRTVVAEDATRIVGFAHVCPSRDDATAGTVGELASIYVLPEAWGRGFGRELVSGPFNPDRGGVCRSDGLGAGGQPPGAPVLRGGWVVRRRCRKTVRPWLRPARGALLAHTDLRHFPATILRAGQQA